MLRTGLQIFLWINELFVSLLLPVVTILLTIPPLKTEGAFILFSGPVYIPGLQPAREDCLAAGRPKVNVLDRRAWYAEIRCAVTQTITPTHQHRTPWLIFNQYHTFTLFFFSLVKKLKSIFF